MHSFKRFKSELRALESEHDVVPANIHRINTVQGEKWELSIEKLMFYRSKANSASNHPFQAATPNYDLHASVIQSMLEEDFPGMKFEVSVNATFKVLPIPFINIPIKIPFFDIGWRKAPNKVRGDDSLGTVPTSVKITCQPNNQFYHNARGVWDALNKIACTHTYDDDVQNSTALLRNDIVERPSKNPFRYLLMGISRIGKAISKSFWDCLPTVSLTRPYPYGYPRAQNVLDVPIINSGVGAHAANGLLAAIPAALVLGCTYLQVAEAKKAGASSSAVIAGTLFGSKEASSGELIAGGFLSHASNSTISGFGRGLVLNQTLVMSDKAINNIMKQSSEGCHAPFATKTVIRPK